MRMIKKSYMFKGREKNCILLLPYLLIIYFQPKEKYDFFFGLLKLYVVTPK